MCPHCSAGRAWPKLIRVITDSETKVYKWVQCETPRMELIYIHVHVHALMLKVITCVCSIHLDMHTNIEVEHIWHSSVLLDVHNTTVTASRARVIDITSRVRVIDITLLAEPE